MGTTSNATPVKPTENPVDIPDELQRIIDSRVFEKSPALRRLLFYLWEHRSDEINEYSIAIDALDRREDFDPRTDAAVRVQVARLRQKLKEFYEDEGASSTQRVTIPLGLYQVRIEFPENCDVKPLQQTLLGQTGPASQNDAETEHTKSLFSSRLLLLSMIPVALVLGCLGGIKWQQSRTIPPETGNKIIVPSFWKILLKSGTPVRIVMPTPVFFTWAQNNNTLIARDPAVNSYRDLNNSVALAGIAQRLGRPILAQDYMVASDTRASFRLAQYLQPFGTHIVSSSSSDIPPESADNDNLILLGTIGTLSPYRSYLERLHFRIPEHEQYIEDMQPSPGAPSRFATVRESPTRIVAPGIIAVLPGRNPNSFVLILAGYHTNALVSYLTSSGGLEDLQKVQSAHGKPRFFEAVLLSEINDVNPLRSWVADFKPFYEGK